MKPRHAWGAIAVVLLVGLIWAEGEKPSATNASERLEQGKYLVNSVAGCNDCHTPYTDKGVPDETKYLQGAALMFKPTLDMPWAAVAPGIIGLPMLSEKDAVDFLMTGKLPGGMQPRPPMPSYRMKKKDAEAVVAYLKSLK